MHSSAYWFQAGFNTRIRALILEVSLAQKTVAAKVECYRWAQILLDKKIRSDIEIHEGVYLVDGDLKKPRVHTWLDVNGKIFDPTVTQYDGSVDAAHYEMHTFVEMKELPGVLREIGTVSPNSKLSKGPHHG